uniref:Uncharacterized protein n=1 Tax=Coccidioides posadasii RMSCC 3488 TaxID=454284 RepID=A0A0J6FGE3_COCPO|nr:hypothetical protein CPAG_05675 [Coccidioides posadasii RMSCC 3488]
MASFWHRLFGRESNSADRKPKDSPKKKLAGHRRSISQLFSSPMRKFSDRETSPQPPPHPPTKHRVRISCHERIHYPIYNPDDPRHNPEVRNRPPRRVLRKSLDQAAAPRTVSPKKTSPSKSLRQARSNLKALADSIRPKSIFNRKSIPSFPEATSSAPEPGRSQLGTLPSKSEDGAFVHRSLPVDIPSNCSASKATNNDPQPKSFSPSTAAMSDEATSLYGTKPSLKTKLSCTPMLSRLFDRQSRRTRYSSELDSRKSSSDAIIAGTGFNRNSQLKTDDDGGDLSGDDIFGPLCDMETPSSRHGAPTRPHIRFKIHDPTRSPHSKNPEPNVFLKSPIPCSTTIEHDSKVSDDASISSPSCQTTVRLPSSCRQGSSQNSDSRLSLEPGMWMSRKNWLTSQPPIHPPSECNTEKDPNFGAELCRTDCQIAESDDSLVSNPLLGRWLVSMGAFGSESELKLFDALSLSGSSGSPKSVESKFTSCRHGALASPNQQNQMTGDQSELHPFVSDEPSDVANASDQHRYLSRSTIAGSSDGGQETAQAPSGANQNGAIVNLNPRISMLRRILSECHQDPIDPLPSGLQFMIEAIDRTSGLELDCADEKEVFQSPAKLFPIGLSESLREEQLRLRRSSLSQSEAGQRECAPPLTENLCTEDGSPRKRSWHSNMRLSISTDLLAPISLGDSSDHGITPKICSSTDTGRSAGVLSRKEGSSSDSHGSSQSEPMSSTTYATTFSSISSIRDFDKAKNQNTFSSSKEVAKGSDVGSGKRNI